ncbi:glycosyltransferase family 4 protein [Dyadobacter jiangsuensis]
MNVLLSAYACEPNKGSEPGVGWHWAIEVAQRGHAVFVLTRSNNRTAIESVNTLGIIFIYYDLPSILVRLKPLIGVNLYYMLWQIGAAYFFKKKYSHLKIDLIHHITFGVFRNVSYLPFFFDVPFAFGPVGGGESTPLRLRKSFPLYGKVLDILRDTLNFLTFYNPLYRKAIRRARYIFAKTEETFRFIPADCRDRTQIRSEIGIELLASDESKWSSEQTSVDILYVGRFIYWKGAHLALKAFARLQRQIPEARMTLIGKGTDQVRLKRLVEQLSIKNITWVDWVKQDELARYYKTSSLMLFPSLHDSSGNVVLEALSYGLPVVCLDIGGPVTIVGRNSLTVVGTKDESEDSVVEHIFVKLKHILSDQQLLAELKSQAIARASELSWSATVNAVYSAIEAEGK